jgi:hypothetical protein
MGQVDPNPNQRKNKDFPNLQETRFTDEMEDNRFLEGDGEKDYFKTNNIHNPGNIGNKNKTNDTSEKLFDR